MKRKKTLLFGGLGLFAFGGLALVGCGVLPQTPKEIPAKEPESQDKFVDTLFETSYLDATFDINVKYQEEGKTEFDNYHVYGNALASMENMSNFAIDASFHLDMNQPDVSEKDKLPIFDFDVTYLESTVYLDINSRRLKLKTDDFGTVMNLIMGEATGEEEEPTSDEEPLNFTTSGITDIITNLANMEYEDKGDYYQYTAHTTGTQPDLIFTSTTDYKLKSIAISGIKYRDFTIDVGINTNVLESLEAPIVSPETEKTPYIDVSTYFGAMRKIRKILDEECFASGYHLELTHYEPDTPETKVYLGHTDGTVNMDLAKTIVELTGNIVINNPATETHDDYITNYRAQYFDECIYLDYRLNSGGGYKLAYTNAGLQDMWDLLGDESVLGINIFDLIFGASDKEYPILDIIADAKYKDITKYGAINFTNDYIEIDVDNYLLGGKGHGSIKININEDDITSITISSLDINSYIVDGKLSFTDFTPIKKINKLEYSPLDNLDKLIRSGAEYFRSKKYALGLDISIINADNKELSVKGDAQINLDNTLGGNMKVKVNDFNNRTHNLTLNSRLDDTGGDAKINNIYASYKYQENEEDVGTTVNLKASYDSILSIYEDIMHVVNDNSSNEEPEVERSTYDMIAPFIANATKDTIEKVLAGDYFALLRDEVIKEIKVTNNKFIIVLDKEMVGFAKDITLTLELDSENVLKTLSLSTKYTSYEIDAKFTLNDYDEDLSYIDSSIDYYACDSLTELTSYLANTSNNGHFKFLEQVSEIMENRELGINLDALVRKDGKRLFTITDGRIDGKLKDTGEEHPALLDSLDLVIQGTVNSNFDNRGEAQDHMDIKFGYKDDKLSLMLGEHLKLYCDKDNLTKIIESINELLKNDAISSMMEAGSELTIPALEMFNAKDYQGLLSTLKGVAIEGENLDYLKLTLSNELVNPNDHSTFDLMVNIDTTGIKSIAVSGLKFSGYEFDVALELDSYTDHHLDPVADGYLDISNIKNVVDQINDILTNKKLGLNLDFTYNGSDIKGYAELDIPSKLYTADIEIDGEQYIDHDDEDKAKRPYTRIRLENDGLNCYLIYEDGTKIVGSGVNPDVIELNSDDTVRIRISEDNLDTVISSITNMVSEEGYVKDYVSKFIGNLVNAVPQEGEEVASSFDITSVIYKDYVKDMSYNKETNTLTVILNGSEIGLDEDATLVVTFDSTTHRITNITGDTTVEANPAHIDLDITEYDGTKHAIPSTTGSWVGADSITNVVKYVETLNKEQALEKVTDQLNYLMDERKAGLTYDISIGKKAKTPIINLNGNIDVDLNHLDLTDLEKLNEIAIAVDGTITNTENNAQSLNANFDLRLVDGVAYFKYLHDSESNFRVQYTLRQLSDLKDLIYSEAETNPTLAQFINSLFPSDAADSTKTPFARAMSTGNYIPLLQYFDRAYVEDGTLYIVLSGDVIDNEGYIEVGINANSVSDLKSISIKDFYAFGYYLTGTFVVDPANETSLLGYNEPVAPTDGTYVVLDDVNYIFQDIIELFADEANKTVGYDLSLRYGDMLLSADANFILNCTTHAASEDDFNDGTIHVKFSSGNKTHVIQADVNAKLYQNGTDYQNYQKELAKLYAIPVADRTEQDKANIKHYEDLSKAIVDDANDRSVINLSYVDTASATTVDPEDSTKEIIAHGVVPGDANYMYGTLTLGTIGDIYNVVQRVMSGNNARFANIMSMFSNEEGTQSIFSQILKGDIEAFLYNKIIKGFSYEDNTYTITLNGDIFKVESTDNIQDVVLKLKTKSVGVAPNEKKVIDYISIDGIYQGDKISAKLSATDYVEQTKISLPASAYNFTSLEDVADVILNTAEQDDFIFSGTLTLDIDLPSWFISMFGVQNTPMPITAQMHIETDPFGYENTTGIVSVTNISEIPYVSEDTYVVGSRTFNIYLENVVQYYETTEPYKDRKGNIIKDKDGNEIYYRPKLDADGEVVRDTNVCLEVTYTKKGTSTVAYKRTRLGLDEFLNELPYYLVNYGLGIKTKVDEYITAYHLELETNLHSTDAASTHVPTYSTLLKNYSYDDAIIQWNATVDAKDLLGNDIIGDLGLTITGQDLNSTDPSKDSYIVLKNLYATLGVTTFMNAILDLDYQYYDSEGHINTIDPAVLEAIHNYIATYKGVVGDYKNLDTSKVSKGQIAVA